MTPMIRARIDTQALRHNLEAIRGQAPGRKVMAVIKANAYGHGLAATAQALSAADAFAVARIDEGLQLCAAAVRAPIVLLEGVFSKEQLAEAAAHELQLVVHDPLQIELLERYAGEYRFTLWIKIDTGMNRLGFRPPDFAAALRRLQALRTPAREIRLMTHLARADEPAQEMTRIQTARFRQCVGASALVTSIGNSAGIFGGAESQGDWIRPGLALYGVSPFGASNGTALGLRPAMTLQTRVIATKRVPRNETVGYGGAWLAQRDTRIAILSAGYGDGLRRSLAAGTPVLVAGQRAALVGRVSMDMIAIDITDLPSVQVGDSAVLWGAELSVETIAAHAGTIAYELLCAVNQRVPLEHF